MRAQSKNQFNLLRIIAVILVFYSRCYALVRLPEPGFLGAMSLGGLGVAIFFAISGYLVTASFQRDSSPLHFLRKRVLRVFPALILVSVGWGYGLGTLITPVDTVDYFKNWETHRYVLKNILLAPQFNLPGVFVDNPYPAIVNGSLWTLPLGFIFYLVIALFCLLPAAKYQKYAALALALGTGVVCYQMPVGKVISHGTDLFQVMFQGPYFFVGAFLAYHREWVRKKGLWLVLPFCTALLALAGTPYITVVAWIAVPSLTVFLGEIESSRLPRFETLGGMSYGIYLWAFPLQQLMLHFLPNGPGLIPAMVLAALGTLCFAYLSWTFVERPVLAPGRAISLQGGLKPAHWFIALPRLHPWLFWATFVFVSYWLFGYRPIAAFPLSLVDDGLYMLHGQAFVEWVAGHNPHWLGDYDYFLLSKAPLFGVFLGVLHLLCVPMRVGEFCLLILLPVAFTAACRPVIVLRGWWLLVPAVLLVWLPFLPNEIAVQRSGFQGILTSYTLIACIGLIAHVRSSRGTHLGWAAFLGTMFSLCYLNREEAAWLGLVVGLTGGLYFAMAWLQGCLHWPLLALVAVMIVACAAAPILLVSTLNYRAYGVFLTTYRRSSAFTAAIQRMTSLEPELRKRYVPIAHDTRFRAYELSPTFARLKPFLEGNGSYWVAGNEQHSRMNGYDPKQNDFFVSNYEFALQCAAFFSGAHTAPDADRLFSAIDRELGDAIRAGKIRAGLHGPATLAAFQAGDVSRIAHAWWESLYAVLTLRAAGVDWNVHSKGDAAALEKVSLFLHTSLTPEERSSLAYKSRRLVLASINKSLRIVYWLTLPVLLIFSWLTYRRKRPEFLPFALLALVPLSAVALVCLTMAVIETLGFHFLAHMGYNVLAYAPFAVLSAFTSVVVLAYFRRPAIDKVKTV